MTPTEIIEWALAHHAMIAFGLYPTVYVVGYNYTTADTVEETIAAMREQIAEKSIVAATPQLYLLEGGKAS